MTYKVRPKEFSEIVVFAKRENKYEVCLKSLPRLDNGRDEDREGRLYRGQHVKVLSREGKTKLRPLVEINKDFVE